LNEYKILHEKSIDLSNKLGMPAHIIDALIDFKIDTFYRYNDNFEPNESDRVWLWDSVRRRRVGGGAAPLFKNVKDSFKRNIYLSFYLCQDNKGEIPVHHWKILKWLRNVFINSSSNANLSSLTTNPSLKILLSNSVSSRNNNSNYVSTSQLLRELNEKNRSSIENIKYIPPSASVSSLSNNNNDKKMKTESDDMKNVDTSNSSNNMKYNKGMKNNNHKNHPPTKRLKKSSSVSKVDDNKRHIPLWNIRRKTCLNGNNAPMRCDLIKFLQSRTEYEVYTGQNLINEDDEELRKAMLLSISEDSYIKEKLPIWDIKKKIKFDSSNEFSPMRMNLISFLSENPGYEMFINQDATKENTLNDNSNNENSDGSVSSSEDEYYSDEDTSIIDGRKRKISTITKVNDYESEADEPFVDKTSKYNYNYNSDNLIVVKGVQRMIVWHKVSHFKLTGARAIVLDELDDFLYRNTNYEIWPGKSPSINGRKYGNIDSDSTNDNVIVTKDGIKRMIVWHKVSHFRLTGERAIALDELDDFLYRNSNYVIWPGSKAAASIPKPAPKPVSKVAAKHISREIHNGINDNIIVTKDGIKRMIVWHKVSHFRLTGERAIALDDLDDFLYRNSNYEIWPGSKKPSSKPGPKPGPKPANKVSSSKEELKDNVIVTKDGIKRMIVWHKVSHFKLTGARAIVLDELDDFLYRNTNYEIWPGKSPSINGRKYGNIDSDSINDNLIVTKDGIKRMIVWHKVSHFRLTGERAIALDELDDFLYRNSNYEIWPGGSKKPSSISKAIKNNDDNSAKDTYDNDNEGGGDQIEDEVTPNNIIVNMDDDDDKEEIDGNDNQDQEDGEEICDNMENVDDEDDINNDDDNDKINNDIMNEEIDHDYVKNDNEIDNYNIVEDNEVSYMGNFAHNINDDDNDEYNDIMNEEIDHDFGRNDSDNGDKEIDNYNNEEVNDVSNDDGSNSEVHYDHMVLESGKDSYNITDGGGDDNRNNKDIFYNDDDEDDSNDNDIDETKVEYSEDKYKIDLSKQSNELNEVNNDNEEDKNNDELNNHANHSEVEITIESNMDDDKVVVSNHQSKDNLIASMNNINDNIGIDIVNPLPKLMRQITIPMEEDLSIGNNNFVKKEINNNDPIINNNSIEIKKEINLDNNNSNDIEINNSENKRLLIEKDLDNGEIRVMPSRSKQLRELNGLDKNNWIYEPVLYSESDIDLPLSNSLQVKVQKINGRLAVGDNFLIQNECSEGNKIVVGPGYWEELESGASDTYVSPHSMEAAIAAASVVCSAVDAVFTNKAIGFLIPNVNNSNENIDNNDDNMNKKTLEDSSSSDISQVDLVKNVFCCIRPPGHHAGRYGSTRGITQNGFCLLNNVAIGAYYARVKYGLRRVAVVDIDAHFGNGTAEIFEGDPDAFYSSVHLQYDGPKDLFFPSSCQCILGSDMNEPNCVLVNVYPNLRSGVSSKTKKIRGRSGFRQSIKNSIIPSLYKFDPDIIFISAGFDGAASDPIGGHLGLKPDDFHWVTQEIQQVADNVCNGKVVSVLEGGYDVAKSEGLATCAEAHVLALSGRSL
jgi:acetoin utilization deacetylase AcuC-like enzyme